MSEFPAQIPLSSIDAKHPEWTKMAPYWDRLRKLHDPHLMEEHAREFLTQRSMEPSGVYSDRIARFCYIPHLTSITGWYVSALFKDPPTVITRKMQDDGTTALLAPEEKEAAQLVEFQENCDGAGRSLIQFWAESVQEKVLVYRKAYILFDLPVSDPQLSRAAQLQTGALRPHLVAYGPQEIINWQCDERGNLDWVILKLRSRTQDTPFDKPLIKDQWYVFTRSEVILYEREVPVDQDGKIYEDQPTDGALANLAAGYPRAHSLAEQNIVPLFLQETDATHWIANRIASALCRLLNVENAHDWSLEQTNLAMLVLKSDQPIDKVVRAEASYLQIGKDDSAEYLEQTGVGFEASQSRMRELREEIFRLAYLVQQGRSSSATPAAQSGYSKEIDNLPSRDALSALGDRVRNGMQLILQTAADVMDLPIDVDVQGFDFLDRAELAELEVIERAETIMEINSPTLERETAKKLARIKLRDANREIIEQIDKEINDNPTMSSIQQQQMTSQTLMSASRGLGPRLFEDAASAA